MEWRPPVLLVCLHLVILPSTTKSRRSFLLAPAHLGGPGKKGRKTVVVGGGVVTDEYILIMFMSLVEIKCQVKDSDYSNITRHVLAPMRVL